MFKKVINLVTLVSIVILLAGWGTELNNTKANNNLINKVNAVDDSWTNYDGEQKLNNSMTQSQFIPYDSIQEYKVNYPTYVSYYNGEDFIKTVLYKNTPDEIESVDEADGLIVSFNKKNKPGMQLVAVE